MTPLTREQLEAMAKAATSNPPTGIHPSEVLALIARVRRAEAQLEAERFIWRSCSPDDPTGVRNAARIKAAEGRAERAEARAAAWEPVVRAAVALRHQCNLPVEDYRRLGGRFDDGIAGPLICKVLAAVDNLPPEMRPKGGSDA